MSSSRIQKKRQYILGSLVLLLVVGSLLGTLNRAAFAAEGDRYADLQVFAKVLNLIQKHYVDEVDTKKLVQGAIKGMLGELDPHTNYLPTDIFKEFESETSGEFGGLGIEITVQDGVLTIISPIEDAPAWVAGIKAGDKILEINGTSTKGMTLSEASQKMKGKKGDSIRLGIFREGSEKIQQFDIKRGVVKIHSVKYTDLGEGLGYFRITSFIENTGKDLEKNIDKLLKENKGGIKGVILDLRRNPGGLLDQAVKVSDLFLDEGVIVSTIGRDKKEKELIYAKKSNSLGSFPIIVLINEYSASASEIVAGALRDNQRALVMGKTSFGKGSVQSVVKLGDGSGLKLTVARYYTPSGVSIQAEGIKPDIFVDELDPEALDKALIQKVVRRERDIEGHLVGDREKLLPAEVNGKKEDPVSLTWASQLKKKKGLSPKEQLLSSDYQLIQAFNYLRAFSTVEEMRATRQKKGEAVIE